MERDERVWTVSYHNGLLGEEKINLVPQTELQRVQGLLDEAVKGLKDARERIIMQDNQYTITARIEMFLERIGELNDQLPRS